MQTIKQHKYQQHTVTNSHNKTTTATTTRLQVSKEREGHYVPAKPAKRRDQFPEYSAKHYYYYYYKKKRKKKKKGK